MDKETKLRFKPLAAYGAVAAVAAFVMLLGSADSVGAQATFTPELNVTLATTDPEVSSDFTTTFNLPDGDVNFAGVVAFIPPEWGIVKGNTLPVGADVGNLRADATLGLINASCNQPVPVEFDMKNGSINRDDTVSFNDDESDDDPDREFAETLIPEKEIFEATVRYPEFLDRIVDAQPIRRAVGVEAVAGTPVLLQFLIFPPGTLIDEEIPNDPALGYPSVTFLQNAGDDEAVPAPGVITDFCTPLATNNISFGFAQEGCSDKDSATGESLCEPTTDPLFVNPTDGTYTFTTIALGQRDADGDTYENSLDTCPLDPNVGNPRIPSDGDVDSDGLDQACDPDGDPSTGTNSDQDLDGYLNRQDNCPLIANGEQEDNQEDTDLDQIGDACDPDPAVENGELSTATPVGEVVVGNGNGGEPGEAPSEAACPNCYRDGDDITDSRTRDEHLAALTDVTPSGDAEDTPKPGEDTPKPGETPVVDDDDGGSSAVPIVVGVIAAVVIIGGGAALVMRRRNA